MVNFNDNFLANLEKNFKVIYPKKNFATYKSLVNYNADLNLPIQRWYRYKEGYSVKLVSKIFAKYKVQKTDLIMDPFCGSGSTLLQAKMNNFDSIGFEINPFSAFLAKVKTQDYSYNDLKELNEITEELSAVLLRHGNPVPKLTTIKKLFDKNTLDYLLTLKDEILKIKNSRVRDLFLLAWLGVLEEASNYRKAGNGLKIRKTIKKIVRGENYTKEIFFNLIEKMKDDLDLAIKLSGKSKTSVIEETSLRLNKYVKYNTVKGVIFSPPYANCFDYTEIYKVELWMGGFVKEYSDLKLLRKKGIRSHLNGYITESSLEHEEIPELGTLVKELNRKKLWDKRIPQMVEAYFNDMFHIIDEIYKSLIRGGFCVIIVSNSSYGGVVVPSDLLISKYASILGLKVTSIEVARYIITSSQQYKQTEKYRKYLRESIIYLEKK